jgi:hypothetical protein
LLDDHEEWGDCLDEGLKRGKSFTTEDTEGTEKEEEGEYLR